MRFKFLSKNKINSLPRNSGVYAFKKRRKLLYIGKAANLRERVKNHFSQPGYRDNLFMDEVKKIGFIKTDSEIEALILEADLIKKLKPKYNVLWRDDKNYFFVAITKEDFPRIFWTHQIKLKTQNLKLKTEYIGPFVDGKALKRTLKVLRKVFPYRSCKKIPKKPCLWYQLGRCPAPCLLKSKLGKKLPTLQIRTKKECQANAKNLMKILQGKKKQVLKGLKREMKKQAKIENFEVASKIRDQIHALEKILAHAKIFKIIEIETSDYSKIEQNLKKLLRTKKAIKRIEAYDVSNIRGQQATGSMVTFIEGKPEKNFYRKFRIKISGKPNDIAMIKEVLKRRLRHSEWEYPDLILIDGGQAQLNAACSCLRPDLKQISVLALAKKKNKLYIEKQRKPILLKTLPRGIFNLILQLRDEAHRFARKYHIKLREKALLPH